MMHVSSGGLIEFSSLFDTNAYADILIIFTPPPFLFFIEWLSRRKGSLGQFYLSLLSRSHTQV